MSDEPKKRSWKWIAWTALALIALYPLSVGPVLLLAGKWGGLPAAIMVYAPILGTLHRWPAVGRVVLWYLRLWGVF